MTGIEWVRNPDGSRGVTLNSKTGCLNHTPEGLCLGGLFPCYAYKLANARLKPLYLANDNWPQMILNAGKIKWPIGYHPSTDPFYPRWWPERLDKIRAIQKPTGIFLDDMSDWMGDYWPREWTMAELQTMRENPQHRFYTLTKQAQRLPEFSPFPDNCWVGVTATSAKMLREELTYLEEIEAKVRFVSLEPLLSRIYDPLQFLNALPDFLSVIDWLIIGACTGSWVDMANLCMKHTNSLANYVGLSLMQWGNKWTAHPKIEWVREIVEAADKAGIPVFLKDKLRGLLPKEPPFYTKCCAEVNGKDPCYEEPCLSEHLIDECSKAPNFWMLRQEMPNG